MSEYTPTTEEVRDSYDYQFTLGMSDISRIAEFDRWLADHDMQVRAHALAEGWDRGARWGLESNVYDYDSVNPYSEEKE